MNNKIIAGVVEKGLVSLEEVQGDDGGFFSFSSFYSNDFIPQFTYQTTFATSLILLALAGLESGSGLDRIRKQAAQFLVSQKSTSWSWNYWVRDCPEARAMPYPDDLDDTFCALAALFHSDRNFITGKVLASVAELLTATEVVVGGPYQTWLVSKSAHKKWKDVDLAVNVNVAYFLFLNEIDLPQLTSFIESSIEKMDFTSSYYPSVYPIIYFLSRFYTGVYVDKLRDFLLAERGGDTIWGNPLQTALAVSSLIAFGIPKFRLSRSIDYLLETQKEGVWKPYGFCLDPAREGKSYYAGSSALTSAFCLEALSKYAAMSLKKNSSLMEKRNVKQQEKIYQTVLQRARESFSPFDTEFRDRALGFLDKLLENDGSKQIPLLPYYFSLTLGEKKKDISEDLVITLGVANVLGWIAYTIYDDFLDEEGDPLLLCVANVAMRKFTSIFDSVLSEERLFGDFFHRIMDQLDGANSWEISHCRIKVTKGKIAGFRNPDYEQYEQLAHKSLGHALGPIAILFSLGFGENSEEVTLLLIFFQHYLIARQLHDDAHDWEKDLQKGQINSVGAILLGRIYESTIKRKKIISLAPLFPRLQKLFWHEVIGEVCDLVFVHIGEAKNALKHCSVIVDRSPFEQLLVRYEKGAEKALRERENALEFLSVYTGNDK